MQLEQVDHVDAESTHAHLALLAQIVGATTGMPGVRPSPEQAGLGSDDGAVRVGMYRLADQLLRDVRTVGVGSVEEVDAELDGSAEHPDRLVVICRRSPDAGTGQTHRAKPEAVDLRRAQLENAARGNRHHIGHQSSSVSFEGDNRSPRTVSDSG